MSWGDATWGVGFPALLVMADAMRRNAEAARGEESHGDGVAAMDAREMSAEQVLSVLGG
jgi:hypothetical protein